MRRLLLALCLAASAVPATAVADTPTKDAKIGAYVRYSDANIRIDKIEAVRHVDGNPLVKDLDPGDNGYIIFSLSVQNPGGSQIFMPAFNTTVFLDDQSKIQSDIRGPYVGAGTTDAPGNLSPKESVRVRFVVPDWPGRRITKIVLNNGSPMLRYQIGPNDIPTLAEIPRPKPTE